MNLVTVTIMIASTIVFVIVTDQYEKWENEIRMKECPTITVDT